MPFVKPACVSNSAPVFLLPRLLGHAKASELLLLGEGFSGEQAAEWGIATEALGSGEAVLAKAREMALRFESLPPEAVRISKQLMKAPDREQLRKVIEEEGALFTQRLRSPEAMIVVVGLINRRWRWPGCRHREQGICGVRKSGSGASLLAMASAQATHLQDRKPKSPAIHMAFLFSATGHSDHRIANVQDFHPVAPPMVW